MKVFKLPNYIEILTLLDLIKLINNLKEAKTFDDITQYEGNYTLDEINEDTLPSIDILEMYFEDFQKNRYVLSCEKYHGIGGVFKLLH